MRKKKGFKGSLSLEGRRPLRSDDLGRDTSIKTRMKVQNRPEDILDSFFGCWRERERIDIQPALGTLPYQAYRTYQKRDKERGCLDLFFAQFGRVPVISKVYCGGKRQP